MNVNATLTQIEIPRVEIYTDGGCEPNPGPGGYGVVLLHPKTKKRAEGSGGFRLTSFGRGFPPGRTDASARRPYPVDEEFCLTPLAARLADFHLTTRRIPGSLSPWLRRRHLVAISAPVLRARSENGARKGRSR